MLMVIRLHHRRAVRNFSGKELECAQTEFQPLFDLGGDRVEDSFVQPDRLECNPAIYCAVENLALVQMQ